MTIKLSLPATIIKAVKDALQVDAGLVSSELFYWNFLLTGLIEIPANNLNVVRHAALVKTYPALSGYASVGLERHHWITLISEDEADAIKNRTLSLPSLRRLGWSLLVPIPLWTPKFNPINSYAKFLAPFTPTGAGTVLSINFVHKSDATIQQLAAPGVSAFNVILSAANVISFNLLASVTIDGLAATSGVTVVPDGYHELIGDLDPAADIDVLASNAAFANNFRTQLHLFSVIDPLDSDNSLVIDTVIRAGVMPTETDIFNSLEPTLGVELATFNPTAMGTDGSNTITNITNTGFDMVGDGSVFFRANYLGATLIGVPYDVEFDAVKNSGTGEVKVQFESGENALLGTTGGTGHYKFTAVSDGVTPSFARNTGGLVVDYSITNISIKQTNKVGDLINLGAAQPYAPQLKGGALDRSFEVLKSEQYNGDFTSGDFLLGVRVFIGTKTLTVLQTNGAVGSYVSSDFAVSSIYVAKNGSVVKSFNTSVNTTDVNILLGTEQMMQAGFEYPNVFRALKPDATVGSEYKYYNEGGLFPWIP